MSLQKNLNVSPYYDDFDPQKNFYRVLYKAGFPVQARELTQSQSILQDQIETLMSRLLKEGDNVVPGEYGMVNPASYVRCSSITQGSSALEYIGYTLTGVTSGVQAFVIHATDATADDDATFYVNYTSSGNTSEYSTFIEGEVLETDTPNRYTGVVGVTSVSKPVSTPAIGSGSLFFVKEGSYFIDGFAVRNDEQIITLDKYGVTPTYRVGFVVTESIITSVEDPSLLDNSQGSSNFAAPGADRLKITLTLSSLSTNNSDPNFIVLANIQNGEILGKPGETVKWDWLYDVLAKRTFDESGDYIVKDFVVKPYEYWNNQNVDGVFDASADGEYPPVPGSLSTENLTPDQADSYYALRIDPGTAYVQGREVTFKNPSYLYSNKARETSFRNNTLTQITEGYNIAVTNLSGTPDFDNISGDGTALAFDEITLYRNFIDGYVGEGTDDSGRPQNLGNSPWRTYHVITDNDIGSAATGFTEIYKEANSAVVNTSSVLQRGSQIGNGTVLIANEIEARPAGVMSPRYLTPSQRVDVGGGFFGYNSTYTMGVMTSNYFTEVAVVPVTNGSSNWTLGELVTGELSGAVGTVEEGSKPNTLIISNVVGEFEPGEEVVQGNKVSRIYRDGEVAGFEFVDKGTNNNTVDLSSETEITLEAIGSTITLTVADGDITVSASSIDITSSGAEKLRDFPYPEGTVLNTRINYGVTTSPGGVTGYAISRPGILTNTLTLAKSFYSTLADVNDFSADISIQNNVDSEITDVANGSLFTGAARTNSISCDNFSGDPSDQLVAGDLITFVDDAGRSVNKVVAFVTKPIGYGSLRSKSIIYFTTTLPNNVTGKTVQRIRLRSKGSPNQSLIYQLPQEVVSSLESDPQNTQINYQILKEFIINVEGGATQFTLTSNRNNETFVGNASQTTIAIAENITDPTDPARLEGRVLTTSNIDVSQDNGRKVVYTLPFALTSSVTLKVIAPMFVVNATAKRKIYIEKESLDVAVADARKPVISLKKADVYRLRSVTNTSDQDITDNYFLDNGQRDNVYDIARIVLKDGRPVANTDVKIVFDYFQHSAEGDFFSVDSYTDDEGIGFKAVPTYTPISIIPSGTNLSSNTLMQLRDVVDFRPIVNTGGAEPSQIASLVDGVDAQGSVNYRDSRNGGNGFVPRLPIPGSQFQCDISYFNGRYDSLFLESSGALNLVKGASTDNPQPPADLASAIRLYDIYLQPYTFAAKNINIRKFNYKRFRMKDIAKIENRVDRVEKMITLSILEQSALNVSVRDSVTGLDRFKNGIVVDTFRDHSRGDVGNSQYRNSVDGDNSHLRSPYFKDQVDLEESVQTDEDRTANAYRINNGVITCDYDERKFITMETAGGDMIATRWINLQPYTVFTYDGNLDLTPQIDTFEDITRLPDLVIEDNSLYDAMVNLTGEMKDAGFGTTWGDWETTSVDTRKTGSTVIRNSEDNPNATSNALNTLDILGVEVGFTQWSEDVIGRGGRPPLRVDTYTTTTTQQREQTQTSINVNTASVENTSYGDRVVDVEVAKTMRSVPVYLQAYRLKPNTRYYAFFDDINVTDWISIDQTSTDYPDGKNRYGGAPNDNPKGFGFPLMSDDVGTLTGVFIIPNGRPPAANQTFSDMKSLSYVQSGPTRSFSTGTKTLRITSSEENRKDPTLIEGFAEADFVSSGVLIDKQETIVSTRVPGFSHTTEVIATETRQTQTESQEANYFDPVAQTFLIDENNADGLFVTSLDVFFKTKDATQGVEAYLVSTDGQVPTDQILPHSLVQKPSDTTLRVTATLGTGNSFVLPAGTTITGQTSGATGTIKSEITFNNSDIDTVTNTSNTVYNVLLNNYLNEFVPGEVIVPSVSPAVDHTFTIAEDTYILDRIDLKTLGTGYTTATIGISAPELPNGVMATATAKVAQGKVYDIVITEKGSGYTSPPAITISGDGSGATAVSRVRGGRKAVEMGVCTSTDASAATKFTFKAPVYLLGDTHYAFVVKAPTSLNYNMYTSKLGENRLGTEIRVIDQASLGSLFMSQNGGLWTEDQTQDVTFRLYRAEFKTGATSVINLVNKPIDQKSIQSDPIETNAEGTDETSTLFGDNPKVIRVYHYAHGLAKDDLVAIDGVTGNPGGIPNASINSLHTVLDVGFNTFTVAVDTAATSSGKAGGEDVLCSYNRPYEVVNVTTGAMVFGTSTMSASNRATQHVGISNYNELNSYKLDSANPIIHAQGYYYTGAKQVAGFLNEANNSVKLRGGRSLQTSVLMSTLSSKVSPVIDLDRTNAICVRNIIDNPKYDDDIYGNPTTTVTFNGDVSALSLAAGASTSFDVDGTTRSSRVIDFNPVTKKLKLKGQHARKILTSTAFSESVLNTAGIARVNTAADTEFVPETSNNGSVFSKWLSRVFIFENACDGIELKLSCIFYDTSSIRVYYRPRNIGFDGELANVNWIPFNETGLPNDVELIKPRSADNVDPYAIRADEWQALSFSVQDIPKFDGLAIKIVMTADNPALAPLIDDMQIICTE